MSTAGTRSTGRWILIATIIGSAMAFIDGTVVNVALPALQRALDATAAQVQWVVEAYMLTLSALLLFGGSLGDRLGRRRVFDAGVVLFAIASIGCGLSRSAAELIAARAVQGVGAALLVPASLAIITAGFDGAARGRAIGTWSGFSAITTAIGPVLGGWLVQHVSWRAVFFINVPLAVVVLIVSVLGVPDTRDARAGALDWAGAAVATLGMLGVVYGLIEAGSAGFGAARVIASLAVGVVALAAFVVIERRSRSPMVPPALFRSRTFTGANLLTLLLYAALGGSLFFLPFDLIQVHGYSPTAAGAALTPFAILLFVLSRWAGGLITRYGARLPLVIGPAVAAGGFALFAVPGSGGGYWTTIFPAVVVLGVGMSIAVAPLTTTVMNAADARRAGAASGVNNAVARTAGLIAVAVFGVIATHRFTRAFDQRLVAEHVPVAARDALAREPIRLADAKIPAGVDSAAAAGVHRAVGSAFTGAFREVMLLAAALAVGAAFVAFLTIESSSVSREGASGEK